MQIFLEIIIIIKPIVTISREENKIQYAWLICTM